MSAFDDADQVVVTEVYAAREAPPPDGFSTRRFVEAMSAQGRIRSPEIYYVPGLAEAIQLLSEHVKAGDVVIVLSAGDADQVSAGLLHNLQTGKSALTGENKRR